MWHRRLNILLLYDLSCKVATIRDHVESIKKFSKHNVYPLQILGDIPKSIKLEKFDAVFVHYTLIISMDSYLSATARQRLRHYPGVKAIFIQDEYRFIDRTVNALQEIKADILFTVVPEDTVEEIYPIAKLPDLRKVTILTGYVPQELLKISVTPYEQRKLDVAYRGRELPYWLGEFGQEKWIIGEKFKQTAERYNLKYDISSKESDRIYKKKWVDFLMSTKSVIGVESGASVCDFDSQIEKNVSAYLAEHPTASFTTVRNLFFADKDGKVVIKTISPRCFEAAALRTLLILYEGFYSGILKPWRHYVPLKKDHSNIEEVISVLKNPEKAKKIIELAYNEIALNPEYSFKSMVKKIDKVVFERASQMAFKPHVKYNSLTFKIDNTTVIFRRHPSMMLKKLIGITKRRLINSSIGPFLLKLKRACWKRGVRKVGSI